MYCSVYMTHDLICVSVHVWIHRVLKEQWIRAKYERQEFIQDSKPLVYEEGEY